VVVATGAVIALPAASSATIGRADPISQFFPEIDLNPHGALDNGVGRKHARLFVLNNRVMIEDLDSTNGTQINGQRVPARQPQPLANGDTLIIGKLALRLQE
jgi:pSer/pThr/pTyr-binding forkhead associated (FHA) protein